MLRALAQLFGGERILLLDAVGELAVALGGADGVARLGQDQHDPVAPARERLLDGHRVAQRAVVIRHAADLIRLADKRNRRGRLADVVAVLRHVRLGEVLRLARVRVRRDDDHLRWIVPKARIVQRILAIGIAQRAVHIVQIDKRPPPQEIAQAHVLLAKGVFGVKRVVSSALPGEIRRNVRAAGRHADAQVELDARVQAVIEYAHRVNSAQSAAHVDDSGFHKSASSVFHGKSLRCYYTPTACRSVKPFPNFHKSDSPPRSRSGESGQNGERERAPASGGKPRLSAVSIDGSFGMRALCPAIRKREAFCFPHAQSSSGYSPAARFSASARCTAARSSR